MVKRSKTVKVDMDAIRLKNRGQNIVEDITTFHSINKALNLKISIPEAEKALLHVYTEIESGQIKNNPELSDVAVTVARMVMEYVKCSLRNKKVV